MKDGGLILAVNKPIGWTSFDVCHKLRRVLGWKRVGHAGTLDPPAEGVLIVLCGSATHRSAEFMDLPKEYHARIRFGITTSTDDLSGDVLSMTPIADWSPERVTEVFRSFRGRIRQIPPTVSAVKVGGRRSYALARNGEEVSLLPRTVEIYALDILGLNEPEVAIRVDCSRGTYIRSLARDIGGQLGWGGTLAKLVRTAVGPYRLDRCLTLEEIAKRTSEFHGM